MRIQFYQTPGITNFCFILTTLLLTHCSNNNTQKLGAASASEAAAIPSLMPSQPVKKDIQTFDTLTDLLAFYSDSIQTLETLRKNLPSKLPSSVETGASQKGLMDSIYQLTGERDQQIYQLLKRQEKNEANFEGLKYLVVGWSIPIGQIEALFLSFPPALQNNRYGTWLQGQIQKAKTSESRTVYDVALLDLKFQDTQGSTITLAQSPGEYILLDFWASWCAPCRYENRKMVKKQGLIQDKIYVAAISLDENKESWLQASREDGLNFLNISDLKGFASPIAKELEVSSIPYNAIINKKGQVIASNIWGDSLIRFIHKLPR